VPVGFRMRRAPGAPEREAIEELVRLWLAPPDRAREEREGSQGASVGVRRGAHWWRYDEVNGAMSNQGAPDSGGADELLLDVDAERGTLLRIESRFEREPIVLSEVVEIPFDEAFDEDTFVFTPPAGEAVRSIVDLLPVRRDLTIEQAVALAPFTVWIPARLRADWQTQIGFAAEQDRPSMAPQVHLHYRAPDGTHGLSVAESPAGHPGEHSDYEHAQPNRWRTIDRNQRRMQVREPAESWQPAQVRLELDGTRILIHSTDLGADALADVAVGLVRAPSEPPKFVI
jgi:hypothetical protein